MLNNQLTMNRVFKFILENTTEGSKLHMACSCIRNYYLQFGKLSDKQLHFTRSMLKQVISVKKEAMSFEVLMKEFVKEEQVKEVLKLVG